ncbi:tRNA (guanine(10)-N(2))-dimethyltransferase [Methanobacterium alcaliphilum]|uniref:tRNA (guanine(10)-N(2))-dimethyltransferase n=1 Tax=Methanobacterium alcaliphilum TaxID=392018 RepID=UPI00200A3214|nr:tRNA (guanine(10)-N(2))-dimethyltransferase [Methanobacterium alcaliphilum]MCK9151513.1 tRNA (guanine(10)-N(2))-dimethyltransferase [Methanobacterium alcaliphilum]
MNIKLIKEGLTQIKVPEFEKVSAKAPVFYNPAMELNRDLSILALQEFQDVIGEDINICDAFGGSGIRGIRYSKEIEGTSRIVVNDISPLAIKYTQENAELNEINDLEVSQDDANLVLRKNRGKFDVVDIDPFGTPSFFIESAANSLKSNSMLCITATDTSALCGTYKEPCIRKYNSMPLKTEYCHENGIRILTAFVARTFAKYKKMITVQFSHSSEHYMRLYFNIGKGAKETDESLKNIGFIAHCKKCLFRKTINGTAPHIAEKCPCCGEKLVIGGPLWLGSIQNKDFIKGMVKQAEFKEINQEKKALKLLGQCLEESEMPATFFDIHVICKKLKISAPSLIKTIELLENEGFNVSRTHYSPTAIKTDAPLDKIEGVLLNLIQ